MSTKITLIITTSLLALAAGNAHAHGSDHRIFIPVSPAPSVGKVNQSSSLGHSNLHADTSAIIKPPVSLLRTSKIVKPLAAATLLDLRPHKITKHDVIILDSKANHQAVDPARISSKLVDLHGLSQLGAPASTDVALKTGHGWSNDLDKAIGRPVFSPALVGAAQAQKLHLQAAKLLEVAPNNTIAAEKINHFVTLNQIAGRAAVISAADGAAKLRTVLTTLNKGIASGDVKVVTVTSEQPKGSSSSPAGDNSTIVIDKSDNGKTVYVPASQLSGPDHRTIEVDCKNCKVVIVGDSANGGSETDDRKVVVNGSGDKIVSQGDTANGGGAGASGGQITDNRQIIVNGNKDKVSDGGDTSKGVDGASGGTQGQAGGAGGTITDDRSVIVNGSHDKVNDGTDAVAGGRGGDGSIAGGNGGFGGTITDNRTADINGNSNAVTMGGSSLKGGDGGNGGGGFGGNGGDGGALTDNRGASDNGKANSVSFGNDTGYGGNGGNGVLGP